MWNVLDSVQLLLGTGGIQIEDEIRLKQVLIDLLRNDSLRHELGERAKDRIFQARGAAKRNATVILESFSERDRRA